MIDGRLVAERAATVSVFDRGFLYGDSVFETVRTYAGTPFMLEEHLRRLEWSAERVLIQLPVSLETLQVEVQAAVAAAGNPESYVRVMVTRGQGAMGLDPVNAEHPLRVILVDELKPPAVGDYERGIAVVTYQTQRFGDQTTAAGAKVANYLVAVLAMREARAHGAQEALLTDHTGCIVEGSTSNVFAVKRGRLITPPESAGILPGITRGLVLRAARELEIPVDYELLDRGTIDQVDELFICSSIRELLPVVTVDGRPIGIGSPGPLSLGLLEKFRENIEKT